MRWLRLGPKPVVAQVATDATKTAAPTGELYERKAEAMLEAAGLTLVERNWSCRMGEIDLIMRDGDTLVFVEVRKRDSTRFGGAGASISAHKQARLERAIGLYLSHLPRTPVCRIDAVLFDGGGRASWLKNVFTDSSHG